MKVTVAICTWNRAKLLDKTLREFRELHLPQGVEWELLVVNNNCTDATDGVLSELSQFLPIRRAFEPIEGHSNARNRAVKEMTGDYIIWTDDDVLVERQWLQAYANAFREFPSVAVFGGPVAPWFEGEPPAWLLQVWNRVGHAYATRDLGAAPDSLSPNFPPVGANYALRAAEQRQYLYDPKLGHNKNTVLGGEELRVVYKILEAGGKGKWVLDAKVRHFIPQSRQTKAFLRQYFYGVGRQIGYLTPRGEELRLRGKLSLFWQALKSEMKYRVRRLNSGPESWICHLMTCSRLWGELSAR